MGTEFQSSFDKSQEASQSFPRHGELAQSFLGQHVQKPERGQVGTITMAWYQVNAVKVSIRENHREA